GGMPRRVPENARLPFGPYVAPPRAGETAPPARTAIATWSSPGGATRADQTRKSSRRWETVTLLERGRPSRLVAVGPLAEALGVQVSALLKEPAPRPQTGPGRPPKRAAEPAEPPAPKRPRGRPRKEK